MRTLDHLGTFADLDRKSGGVAHDDAHGAPGEKTLDDLAADLAGRSGDDDHVDSPALLQPIAGELTAAE